MKIEDQFCSFELAKILKELGVKQESLVYWLPTFHSPFKNNLGMKGSFNEKYHHNTMISAFTVAELGEMLCQFNIVTHQYKKGSKYIYNVTVGDMEMRINKNYVSSFSFEEKTEADARAKMLIYLIENKLIHCEKQ